MADAQLANRMHLCLEGCRQGWRDRGREGGSEGRREAKADGFLPPCSWLSTSSLLLSPHPLPSPPPLAISSLLPPSHPHISSLLALLAFPSQALDLGSVSFPKSHCPCCHLGWEVGCNRKT